MKGSELEFDNLRNIWYQLGEQKSKNVDRRRDEL